MGNIVLSNISCLSLNSRINTDYPFTILNEETNEFTSEIFVKINTGENKQLNIHFDPSFKKDFHNETVNGQLTVNYIEHQHTVIKQKKQNSFIEFDKHSHFLRTTFH